MDQLQQRTMFIGLSIGLALYALGFVARWLLDPPVGDYVAIILTFLSMVVVVGFLVAVRRGFRLGKQTRQGKRLKGREGTRPARPPPRF